MLSHGYYNSNPVNNRLLMQGDGPLMDVILSIPSALGTFLTKSGSPLPSPVIGKALIDTGASHSSFDSTIISQLGILPTGVKNKVGTGAGQVIQDTYHITLSVPGHNYNRELPQVAGCNMTGQLTAAGQQVIGVLGRDFLMECILVYNGEKGEYTLAN